MGSGQSSFTLDIGVELPRSLPEEAERSTARATAHASTPPPPRHAAMTILHDGICHELDDQLREGGINVGSEWSCSAVAVSDVHSGMAFAGGGHERH